jgi:PIF1-like helicase/Helix-turn-helix domain/HRDC domain
MRTNQQLELASDFVRFTNKNIFLTGKAGTGKTTFLHQLKVDAPKRMIVVAPTGVAAINAGGVTIHSFFQLPFGPFLPDAPKNPALFRKFSKDKIALIKGLDLLVIDEISMVRSDLLDGIDDVLRRYKDRSKPFGGVQLLMIGDLHQLPPIVKEEEWLMLRDFYDTAYFFGSRALKQTDSVSIELKHIYRQSDETFINLLNKVRDNKMDAEVLDLLNSRFIADFEPSEQEPYITLSSHNASANSINVSKLASLSGESLPFKAKIEGDFPAFSYPTDEILEVKTNAQVMFVKNDAEREKRFYNGKIGKITKVTGKIIYVKCPGDAEEIEVSPVIWENIKYSLDETTKEVKEEIVGSFEQYPLKLAWAITIHKSQGLTFERAIIDANAAFAHGQVYVALSRCKTFEGIVLRSKIANSSVKTDTVVKNYSDEIDKNVPSEAKLKDSKISFQQALILDLFDFKDIKYRFERVERVLLEHQSTLSTPEIERFQNIFFKTENEIITLANKFQPQIAQYFAQAELPEENEELLARIAKAGTYFEEKLGALRTDLNLRFDTDNQATQKSIKETIEILEKEVFIKKACFGLVKNGFTTHNYLKTKANADIDFKPNGKSLPTSTPLKNNIPSLKDADLYAALKQWRDDVAAESGVEAYMVIQVKTIQELTERKPTTLPQLKQISGIGKAKLEQFGTNILGIILDYCAQHNIDTTQTTFLAKPEVEKVVLQKTDTKKLSFELFKAGKTIEEIALERGFAPSTIEGHLAMYVAIGEIDIFQLISKEKFEQISQYFQKSESKALGEAKTYLGDAYSYGELRLVMTYLEKEE